MPSLDDLKRRLRAAAAAPLEKPTTPPAPEPPRATPAPAPPPPAARPIAALLRPHLDAAAGEITAGVVRVLPDSKAVNRIHSGWSVDYVGKEWPMREWGEKALQKLEKRWSDKGWSHSPKEDDVLMVARSLVPDALEWVKAKGLGRLFEPREDTERGAAERRRMTAAGTPKADLESAMAELHAYHADGPPSSRPHAAPSRAGGVDLAAMKASYRSVAKREAPPPPEKSVEEVTKEVAKLYRPASDRRYRISVDGKDALVCFGKHNGSMLSVIVNHSPGYLKWILDPVQDFPREFVDVARYVYDRYNRAKELLHGRRR